jgi:hypothetical protein
MPVIGTTSWSAKLLARAFTSEGMLGVAGCAMACASGSFALYMNMHGPLGGHEPSPYFTVFAQLSPRAHPSAPAATLAALTPAMSEDIDPVVTGSIPQRAPAQARIAGDKPILPKLLLRQIDGDNALVEINDSLVVYKIGDNIPGAGKLLAMTRQAGRPALETSRGLIVESH